VIRRLIFIGRLSPEKQPDIALEISKITGLEVVFIGDGDLSDILKELASQKSIEAKFLGQLIDPWALIKEGDLLIACSRSEGDGLVVLEALQRNMPILLTDIFDFQRFNFPARNYCSTISSFVLRIEDYATNLEDLVISRDIAEGIIHERSLQSVGDSWEKVLGKTHSASN
jgi:glycosyltransferase involved in cell wall biosynthesis